MIAGLQQLWNKHRLLLIAFSLACFLTLFFAARLVMFSLYWANPQHQFQPLAEWMPLRYAAYSWGVKPQEFASELGLKGTPGRGLTLGEIAQRQGLTLEQMAEKLQEIARRQSQ